MLADVAGDGVLEIGLEDAAPNASTGDDREEALDGIDPGGRGRREMEDPARVIGQPFQDLGMLVGGLIIDDGWITLPAGTARSTAFRNLM